MAFKNYRDVQITAIDGGGTPVTFVFTYDSDFSLNIPGRAVHILRDRGVLTSTPQRTYLDDGEMTGGFTVLPEDLFDDAPAETAADFALLGLPDGWVSTQSDVDSVDLLITDGVTEILLPDCVLRGNYTDSGPGGAAQPIAYTYISPHLYPTVTAA